MATHDATMPLKSSNEYNNSITTSNGTSQSKDTDGLIDEDTALIGVAVDQLASPVITKDQINNELSNQCSEPMHHQDVNEPLIKTTPFNTKEYLDASPSPPTASNSYPRGRHRLQQGASQSASRSPSGESNGSSYSDSDNETTISEQRDATYRRHLSSDLFKVATRHLRMSPLLFSVTLLACLFILVSCHAYFTRQLDRKTCDMSYLRPSFKQLDQFDSEYTRLSGKYALYLYREDGYDTFDDLNGIPILFVHGNAGSYKQVKSIGSEAAIYYHKELESDSTASQRGVLGLDFFTLDLNEEFTAFHGQSMLEQAEYINDAIQYILTLYHARRPATQFQSHRASLLYPAPTSVIILGHSMGGVVSRVAFTLPNFQRGSINTILTISSPHIAPPAPLDRKINNIYLNTNAYWRRSFERPGAANPLRDVVLVTISGGRPDNMINSDLCDVASIVPRSHGFTVYSTTIPQVWSSMDHHCILWCVSTVQSIVHTLYDVIDARRESQTRPRGARLNAFRHHLLGHLDESTNIEAIEGAIGINTDRTTSNHKSLLPTSPMAYYPRLEDTIKISLSKQPHYLLQLPLGIHDLHNQSILSYTHDHIQLFPLSLPNREAKEGRRKRRRMKKKRKIDEEDAFIGTKSTNELPSNDLSCASLSHLSGLLPGYATQRGGGTSGWETRIPLTKDTSRWDNIDSDYDYDSIPHSETGRWTVLQLPVKVLKQRYAYIAIIPRPTIHPPRLLRVELSNKKSSIHQIDASWTELLLGGVYVQLTPPNGRLNSLFTHIRFPFINNPMLAYHLSIDASPSCEQQSLVDRIAFPSLVRQSTDRLYSLSWTSPYGPSTPWLNGWRGLELSLLMDNLCRRPITLSISIDLYGSFGRWVKRVDMAVLAFPLAILFAIIYMQLKQWTRTGVYPSFMESLSLFVRRRLGYWIIGTIIISLSVNLIFDDYDTMSTASTRSPSLDAILTDISTSTPVVTASVAVQNAAALMDVSSWNGRALFTGDRGSGLWFLPTVFLLLAIGILVIVASSLLLLLGMVVSFAVWIDKRWPRLARLFSRSDGMDGQRFRRRAISTGLLFLLVITFVPSQFAFLVAFLVHWMACARSWLTGETEMDPKLRRQAWHRFHYQFTLLVLFFACIPFTGPLLVAWVRNISVLWVDPNSSDHALWIVAPYTLLVEIASNSMPPRLEKRFTQMISTLLFTGDIAICLLFGVRDTYMMYDAASWTVSWLVVLHFIRSRAGKALMTYIRRHLAINGKKQH
ncbi:PGAP1-like protein-domain-containing protein [Syncephalis fuscata]|nr:PGAP1-like protein-domain-containing protein [Syncephalis fuscata]